jgi:hypothetical protein
MMDVATALAELDAARSAEHEAGTVLRDAESVAAGARRAFAASPGPELEESVERAEREQRKAERYAAARVAARERAEEAHGQACRVAALERLREIEKSRARVLVDVARVLDDAEGLYDRLVEIVARAHEAAERDAGLVDDALRAAREAGVDYRGQPTPLAVVRVALGIRLADSWGRAELPASERSTGEFQRLLEALASERGTAADRRARLHCVTQAGLDLFGAEAGNWLSLCAAPAWNQGGSYADRYTNAVRLLCAIDVQPAKEGNDDDRSKFTEVQQPAAS